MYHLGHAGGACGVHFERLKQTLVQVIAPRLAGNFANDLGQRKVADIAILPLLARREAERQRVSSLDYVSVILDLERVEAGGLADDPRCVGQEVSDGNVFPCLRRPLEKLADTIVEARFCLPGPGA